MTKIAYVPRRFTRTSRAIIDRAAAMLDEYAADGIDR